MILSGPNIALAVNGSYTIPSPIFPMTGQGWAVEISNFSPYNLLVTSTLGQKLINPFTADTVGDLYGEMAPVPMFFTVTNPASGAPAIPAAPYASVRWCSWPDLFTQAYPVTLHPAITNTMGGVGKAVNILQNTIGNNGTVNPKTLVLPNSVSVGSTIVIAIGSVNTVTSVSDDRNGGYTLLNSLGSGYIFAVANAVAGITTISINTSVVTTSTYVITEYGGMPTTLTNVASASNNDGGSPVTHTSPTISPSVVCILIGLSSMGNSGSGGYTVAGSWIKEKQYTGGPDLGYFDIGGQGTSANPGTYNYVATSVNAVNNNNLITALAAS